MGNTIAKYCKADWVDGGRVKEKIHPDERPLMYDAWGAPIYAPKEYDTHLVKKLIRQRRLAPFYKADEWDAAENSDGPEEENNDSLSDSSSPTRRQRKKKVKKNRPNKDDPESLEASFFNPALLEKDFVDCPICLLAHPQNINYTECCHQPMCTLCFVKIKRPTSGRIISCPFCNHVNFSVCYHKPRWLAELRKPKAEQDESIRPDPVACEALKVNLAVHERIQRMQQRQHGQTQPRYYYASAGRGAPANGPRRYVFYEPSGSYTVYDSQYYRPAGQEPPEQQQQQHQQQEHQPHPPQQPTYYQHYQQQEYQRQQALRSRAEAYERAQLEEAIRRSMIESGEAAQAYAAANSQ